MADEHESPQSKLDVVEILRRRGALFLWVAAIVVLVGVAIAYRQTPMYASRGVLLAELPSVSEAAVRSVQPESRVTLITQRVLTSENLQEIIDKHGLYPDLAGMPAEARSRFRENLKPSAEDPQILEALLGTTRPEGTMAFSLTFSDASPRVARDRGRRPRWSSCWWTRRTSPTISLRCISRKIARRGASRRPRRSVS